MENCSTDTLLSLKHLQGLRHAPLRSSFSASQPSFDLAPHSLQWHPPGDLHESRFIAFDSQADCPQIKFARNHPFQGGLCKLLYRDPTKVYPSPPSGSSSKTTVPLPEENGEYQSVYSSQVFGVLDSPTVMRREDLTSHIPLTPPPTLPHPTLDLPDADVDVEFDDERDQESENEYDDDEPFCGPSETSSHSEDADLPLSPLSPTWDSPCPSEPALSVALVSETPSRSEQILPFWSPIGTSKALPDRSLTHSGDVWLYGSQPAPCSLLGIDAPRPLLAPISIPWSPHPSYDMEQDSPPSTTSNTWSSPSTDFDALPPPSSPLISRLDLPEVDEDEMPHFIPSSPSRRSFSDLPDTDIEMRPLSPENATPASPSQSLLSLPGAETDDDLLPPVSSSSTTTSSSSPPVFVPHTPCQPLLFIDDPRDVPLPRSPSPEDFDISLAPEEITDPELSQLFDLRKRSLAAERAARRAEALADGIDLFARDAARKTRKRERERSKEVGALLRLKLDGKIGTSSSSSSCPSPSPSPESHEEPLQLQLQQDRPQRRRGMMRNMSQLVAQMVFRRNDTSRPLAKRKIAVAPREYIRSSLSRAVAG